MTMIESGKLYIIIGVSIIFLNQYPKKVESFTETSDLYLRNVVNELQQLNDIDSFSDSSTFNRAHNVSAYYIQPPVVDRQTLSIPKYNIPTQVSIQIFSIFCSFITFSLNFFLCYAGIFKIFLIF